ncbi:PE-PPE domain-containing protein [Mycobacterium sp. 3519A]|uniref:PE-PPE domain-containing protein n=1 Tax=Mycobacterium sp. 3519A TaxID=2057184 RepID=UPI000C7BFA4A|nr:PE-PPE domain-containing protein [Mycobacterium sp. 3519A]
MRKTARAFVLVLLALLTSAVLGISSAFVAAFALGATTALIVPGTGTPNANNVTNYMENARSRYLAPFTTCTDASCTLDGINYPASFYPLGFIGNWCPGFKCDTWNKSVGTGVANLDTALRNLLDNTTDNVVIFGYSQGGAVVSDELGNLGDLTPEQRARIQAVTIGNAFNPDGGIFTRLGFLPTIPFLNITFGPKMPTNTGIPITSIGFQYDPVMYAPTFWGNPFTMLNALAAFDSVHGYYLTPNGNGPTDPIAYGYTDAQLQAILATPCPGPNCRVDANGNKYYMLPAKSLPIVNAVMAAVPAALQPVAKPVADLVTPVLKVLIDLGYDFSGDPGKERWLSPLPFNPIQNWPAVGVNLVAATVQGVQAFVKDLGGLVPNLTPAVQAPVTPAPVSTLAAAKTTETTEPTDKTTDKKQLTTKLTAVKDKDTGTAAQQSADDPEKTTASSEEKPATKPESTTDEKKADEGKADEGKADEKNTDDKKTDEKKTDKKKTDKKKTDKKKAEKSEKTAADKSDEGKAAA